MEQLNPNTDRFLAEFVSASSNEIIPMMVGGDLILLETPQKKQ